MNNIISFPGRPTVYTTIARFRPPTRLGRPTECGNIEGDANSVLAGTLTAAKLGVKVEHVEADLRSYDRRIPEEVNKVSADHYSDLLFAPTMKPSQIPLGEESTEDRFL
ncbi:MAG: UDP-N-acetylglucosamine 2-epimerase [Candidatus Bathyarchaeia archaeon]